MCQAFQHNKQEKNTFEKKYRLKDFFDMHWNEYCKHPTDFIKPEQYKAVSAIQVCQTEVLGIDYYACPDCGEISEVKHSCKNRFCPTCSWKDTIKWSERIKSQIFNIPHRHVVFTLPHQFNGVIKENKVLLLNLLAKLSAETLKDWALKKYNIKIGIVTVLHTFGEKKNAHYHVHMIVSWGGIDQETGELIELKGKEKEYVKYDFLKKKFRDLFIDELVKLFDNDQLKNYFKTRKSFKYFLKKVNRKAWQIHLEPPMDTPAEVIRYIGRYSKRACLSEYKITNIEGDYISFNYKDYREKENPKDEKSPAKVKELKLHYNKFFPLLLQHVPPPYFRMVRYYGPYARFKNIPEEYKVKADESLLETIETQYQTSEDNPKYCSACTSAKIYITTLFDRRKKINRTEPFDIKKHKHIYYERYESKVEERNFKNAA